MTKKHFQLVADVVKEINVRKAHGPRIAELFADALAATNPLFNREKFLAACGV